MSCMAEFPTLRGRVRNLTELYLRAYWRYYATALLWVGGSSAFFAAAPLSGR